MNSRSLPYRVQKSEIKRVYRNPVKASIAESIDEYVHSSYNEYIEGENFLIDMDFVYSMLSKGRNKFMTGVSKGIIEKIR